MSLIEKALIKKEKESEGKPSGGHPKPDPEVILSHGARGDRRRWLLYACLIVLVVGSASWLVVEWLPLLKETLTLEKYAQRPKPEIRAGVEEAPPQTEEKPKEAPASKAEEPLVATSGKEEASSQGPSEPPLSPKEPAPLKEKEAEKLAPGKVEGTFLRPQAKRGAPQKAKADAAEPRDDKMASHQKREFLMEKAYLNAQAGQLHAALNIYSELLRQDPNDVDALLNRGIIKTRMKDLASAKEDLLRASELRPRDPAIANALGVLYMEMGDLNQAAQWLLSTQDVAATVNLALLYWRKGQEERALALLEDAENRLGNEPRIPYYKAWLLKELRRNKEARKELEKARSLAMRKGETDLLREIDRLTLSP